MAIGRNGAILAVVLAAATGQAQAQDNAANVELTAEMWAMAGVCSQYSNYSVRNDALADWLNNTLAGTIDAAAVMDAKEAKHARITQDTARVQQASGARERAERSDELSASLMTRCRRLTNHPLAGQFFRVTTN